MNPEYISEKGQQNNVKQEYMNYLKLQASNNQRNLDAKRQEAETRVNGCVLVGSTSDCGAMPYARDHHPLHNLPPAYFPHRTR